jgi:hypothetical protein
MTGSMEISLPKALMAGTQFKRTMKRKYRLANLNRAHEMDMVK